jgi:hypothetical protein
VVPLERADGADFRRETGDDTARKAAASGSPYEVQSWVAAQGPHRETRAGDSDGANRDRHARHGHPPARRLAPGVVAGSDAEADSARKDDGVAAPR